MKKLLQTLTVTLLLAAPALANPGEIYAVISIDFMPSFAKSGEQQLLKFAADSRKDPGVKRFEVLRRLSAPNHFTLVEVWENQAAFDRHYEAAHTREFRGEIQKGLGSPFDERLHESL